MGETGPLHAPPLARVIGSFMLCVCRLLSLEGGVELLLQSLPPSSESSAPPYAFLATIAKEGGAIGTTLMISKICTYLCDGERSIRAFVGFV